MNDSERMTGKKVVGQFWRSRHTRERQNFISALERAQGSKRVRECVRSKELERERVFQLIAFVSRRKE